MATSMRTEGWQNSSGNQCEQAEVVRTW